MTVCRAGKNPTRGLVTSVMVRGTELRTTSKCSHRASRFSKEAPQFAQEEMEMLDRPGIMRGECEPWLLRSRLAVRCIVRIRNCKEG